MRNSSTIAGFLECNGGKLEEAEDFKCVFIVCCVFESKKIYTGVRIVEF